MATTRYVKLITDIPEEEKQLWSDLAFNLRSYNQAYNIKEWNYCFNYNTYLFVVIDASKQTYAYSTRNSVVVLEYEPLTLEILKTLNLLKLTGG